MPSLSDDKGQLAKGFGTGVIRGGLSFFANVAGAVLGTAIIESPISLSLKMVTHSPASFVIREWICSGILAALLGALAQRRWTSSTARWVWVGGVMWFLLGGAGHQTGDAWRVFSGIACAEHRGFPCTVFWAFTVPLIRTVAYSTAALISLRIENQFAGIDRAFSHFLRSIFLIGLHSKQGVAGQLAGDRNKDSDSPS
jgi:hypothetical protein